MYMNKRLYVISGSSGVGKGTVIKGFLERNPQFVLSISCTTRKPRTGEVDGESYFFITKEEFKKCINEDKFLEYAQFAGNMYGTKKRYIQECLSQGKDVLLEIDTQGALQVKSRMPEAVLIFICPPSFDDLEKRLRKRNTEDEDTIQRRLNAAKVELERADKFDYKIVNDDISKAIKSIEDIVEANNA